MNDAPDYFSVGASITPGTASSSPFDPLSGADAAPTARARHDYDLPGDGTQSFQDLDISSPPTPTQADAAAGPREEPPFTVTVTDPVRQGEGINAFMVYHVNTKTSLPQYSAGELRVARRFRDFDWLHSQLSDKWPGVIVPPLPEKALAGRVTGVGFTADFIEARRKQLEVFIRRVTAHAELHQSEALQVFLEASDDALESAKAASKAQPGQSGRWGQLLTDSWMGLRSYYGKSLNGMGISAQDGGAGDRQGADLKALVSRLEGQLGALHKAAERLVRRRRAESQGMSELGLAFAQLAANSDSDLTRSLATALSQVGVTCDCSSRSFSDQADAEAAELDERLTDMLRRLQQCRYAIHARETSYHQWQGACSALDGKRSRAARAIGAEAGDGKAAQMETEIGEGEQLVRQAQADYEVVKERTNREVARFHEEVTRDIQNVLAAFVRLQAEGAKREHALWAQVQPRFDSLGDAGAKTAR